MFGTRPGHFSQKKMGMILFGFYLLDWQSQHAILHFGIAESAALKDKSHLHWKQFLPNSESAEKDRIDIKIFNPSSTEMKTCNSYN